MTLTHPLADRDAPLPASITVAPGRSYPVADDGTIDIPDDVVEDLQKAWAQRYSDADEVDSWDDWNEDDWLDLGYERRAEDVREGRVDEYLDAIEDAETSDTVIDAVEQRRDELEE